MNKILLYGLGAIVLVVVVAIPAAIRYITLDSTNKDITGQIVFGVIADTHIDGSVGRTESLKGIVKALNKYNLDFVVELGDAVEGDTTEEKLTQQWRLFDSIYSQVNSLRGYTRGNHETVSGCNYKQVMAWWNINVPNPVCFSADVKGYHLIILEIPLSYPLPPGVVDWLKKDLAQTKYKTVVFSHRPIVWNPAVTWFKDPDVDPAIRETLEQSGKVIACFNGHGHADVAGVVLNGISYYLVPSPAFCSGYIMDLSGKYFVISITGDKVNIYKRSFVLLNDNDRR